MKTTKRASRIFAVGLSLGAAVAHAETIDQTFDYSTNPTNGQWTPWVQDTSSGAVCDAGTQTWDSVNGTYVIEAELTGTCRYIYYRINFPHAVDGSTILQADIKAEATAGSLGDMRIALGYGIDFPGFGATGRMVSDFNYAVSTGGWQAIGGDITPYVDLARQRFGNTIALSDMSELLAKTEGPVLLLINNTKGTSAPHSISMRVTIDNLHVRHDGRSYSELGTDALTAGTAYSTRTNPVFTALNNDVDTASTAIDSLSLSSRTDVRARLGTEAGAIKSAHDDIVTAAATRTDTSKKVRTPAQYTQDLVGQARLHALLDVGSYVQDGGDGLTYYPWEATGHARLDDLSLGVQSVPMQPSQNTLAALGEFEPIAVVLQNLNAADVTINAVTVGTMTNQFGETLPAGKIDVRLVKNWYTGNADSIRVQAGDSKVRVPELLLKDDELVHVDAATKTNSLRIVVGGTQSYQDITSPTSRMPAGATTADAATLQPFPIETLHARELWLTLDTRSDVLPGGYSGDIVVDYQIAGDSTSHQLLVPVQIGVMPVELRNSDMLYSIYYRGRIDPTKANLGPNYKTQAQYLTELADMRDHGVDHPTQYIGSSLTEVANYIGLREGLGLPCDKYFLLDGVANVGTNATTATTNANNLLSVISSNSACTGAQLYMYGTDEATGTALDNELAAMQAVHTAGGKTFVAGYLGTYSHIHSGLDALVFSSTPNDAEIGLWRADGKDVFSYGNPQVGVPDPYVYRANYGFLLWQHDYTGAMDYAYQDAAPGSGSTGDIGGCATSGTASYCSLWNDFDSSIYYDHVFTYPTSNGVVGTVQWEGFREAVDDTRFLATLQYVMQNVPHTELVDAVQDMLDDFKTQAGLDSIVARQNMQYALAMLNQPPVFSDVEVLTGADQVYVVGEASDPEGFLGSVTVSIDGGTPQAVSRDGSWNYTFSGLVDGEHTVHYVATDYWGATTEDERNVEVDTQSPGCGE